MLGCKQNAANAQPEAAVLLQEGELQKIKGLWMQKSFDTNCLAGIVTLNNEFKPTAGHGRSQFWLPCALLLTARGTHLPMLAHLITTLGLAFSVFHGWGDFEGLKTKSVPDPFVG